MSDPRHCEGVWTGTGAVVNAAYVVGSVKQGTLGPESLPVDASLVVVVPESWFVVVPESWVVVVPESPAGIVVAPESFEVTVPASSGAEVLEEQP